MPVDDNTGKPAEHVPTSRWSRFTKLGGTALAAGARHASQRFMEAVAPTTTEVRDEERKTANTKTAKQMVATLSQMKGAAMKVGQLLSVDPQVLPPEIRDELSKLQTNAPPMPFSMVQEVIQGAFGKPMLEVYASFEEKPLGAASIGQVHRAVTLDGQRVAVKIQYPGISDTIDSDVANLGALLKMAQLGMPGMNVDSYLEEFRQVLHREADYVQEAAALERFQTVLLEFPGTRAPKPFKDLTRKNVLTMELIDGVKLDDHLMSLPQAEKNAMASRFLELFIRLFHEFGVLHADPHPGNFLADKEGNIVLLDFGCVRDFEQPFVDGLTNVLRAQWKGDAIGLIPIFTKLGFAMPAKGIPDPELLYEWQELTLEPFLKDEEFDFANWHMEEKVFAFLKDNWWLKQMLPPKPALFYFRVCAGIRGMLTRSGAKVNVYRMAKDMEKRLAAKGR